MRALTTSMAALGFLLAANVTMAQSAKPTASELDGRARFEEGVKLAEAGDHEKARLKFVQAWAVLKHWSVLFNLARAEQLSGHAVDAFRHYREFTKLDNPKIPAGQRELAQTNLVELTKKIGQLAIDVSPGATVTVDGERVDAGQADPIAVTPGQHVVVATLAGKAKDATVTAEPGATVNVSLVEAAPPPPPAVAPVPVAPVVAVDPRPRAGYLVPGALAVAGLAGIGVGVGFALASQGAKEDATRLGQPLVCTDRGAAGCVAYTDARDRASTHATIAWGGYIAGGVLLAGAIGSFVFWPKRTQATGMRVVPVVGPGTAAATLGGTF